MLNITKKTENGELTLSLCGRLDTITAPEFEAVLKSSAEGVSGLTLDFGELEYISSAGLRVLLSAHKQTGGNMKVTHVNETVSEILEITGFADILTVE